MCQHRETAQEGFVPEVKRQADSGTLSLLHAPHIAGLLCFASSLPITPFQLFLIILKLP